MYVIQNRTIAIVAGFLVAVIVVMTITMDDRRTRTSDLLGVSSFRKSDDIPPSDQKLVEWARDELNESPDESGDAVKFQQPADAEDLSEEPAQEPSAETAFDQNLVRWAQSELSAPESDVDTDTDSAMLNEPEDVELGPSLRSVPHPLLADAPAPAAATSPAASPAAAPTPPATSPAAPAAAPATEPYIYPSMDDWEDVSPESVHAQHAAQYVFERFDDDRKSCRKPAATQYNLLVARRQLNGAGREKYRMVMLLGTTEYNVHLEAFPKNEIHPIHSPDHIDLKDVKAYRIIFIDPLPCSAGEAAVENLKKPISSEELASGVNSMKLGWEAKHHSQFNGMSEQDFRRFRLGAKFPAKHEMTPLTQSEMLPEVPIPDSFDARLQGKNCVAFDVIDQGNCGSCYAQAAATSLSSRACLSSNGKYNFLLSPQEMMDCTNGCQGGDAEGIYRVMAVRGMTEDFCDPYIGKQGPCGNDCANPDVSGMRWKVQPQTKYKWVNQETAGAEAEKQIMLEVMQNGPAWVGFDVYSDFATYSAGVYVKSPAARKQGGHAVTLIGWGVLDGKKYWLCQNSWGSSWGDRGTFKIERGVNMVNIEKWGINVAVMSLENKCSAVSCLNGGSYTNDCSCFCRAPWTGPKCADCPLKCSAAGTLIKSSTQCECKCSNGFSGIKCEEGVSVSSDFQCVGSGQDIKFNWGFNKAPYQGSFVAIYPAGIVPYTTAGGWHSSFLSPLLRLCGEPAPDSQCDASGSLSLSKLQSASPGNYSVYFAPHRGYNEFGTTRGYSLPIFVQNVEVRAAGPTCDLNKLKTLIQTSDERFARQQKDLVVAPEDPNLLSYIVDALKTDNPDSVTVQINCAGDVASFSSERKLAFISTLSNVLGLPQSSVKILSVKAASVIVDVLLTPGNGISAKSAAADLKGMIAREDPKIRPLGIQSAVVEAGAHIQPLFFLTLALSLLAIFTAFQI